MPSRKKDPDPFAGYDIVVHPGKEPDVIPDDRDGRVLYIVAMAVYGALRAVVTSVLGDAAKQRNRMAGLPEDAPCRVGDLPDMQQQLCFQKMSLAGAMSNTILTTLQVSSGRKILARVPMTRERTIDLPDQDMIAAHSSEIDDLSLKKMWQQLVDGVDTQPKPKAKRAPRKPKTKPKADTDK